MHCFSVILRAELFSLFISPATYVSAFYFLALLGIGFRFFLEGFASTNWILPPLSSLVLGLTFGSPALIPFLTMKSFSEERKLGTLETLLAAPVDIWGLVCGKWCACFVIYLLIVLGAFSYPLAVVVFFPEQATSLGFLNIEQWIGGFAFLMMTGASFTAIGIFSSSVTKNQMVAGMLTFSILTMLLASMTLSLGDTPDNANISNPFEFFMTCLGSIANGMSKIEFFVVGIIDISTILHQALLATLFLTLTVIQVENLNR